MTTPYADRVKDTSSAQSSTTITLSNAPPTGFQSFNAGIGDGDIAIYLISDGTNWEVNYGGYTDASKTLGRAAKPIASSNSGNQIASFSGTVTVACVDPAAQVLAGLDMVGNYNSAYVNFFATAVSTFAAATGTIYFIPVWIKQWFSSCLISVNVTTASTAGTCSLGIYNSANGSPNTLLATAQTGIATGTVGVKTSPSAFVMPSPQPPGLYWLAYVAATSAATVSGVAGTAARLASEFIGVTLAAMSANNSGFSLAGSVLPTNPSGFTTVATTVPLLAVQPSP